MNLNNQGLDHVQYAPLFIQSLNLFRVWKEKGYSSTPEFYIIFKGLDIDLSIPIMPFCWHMWINFHLLGFPQTKTFTFNNLSLIEGLITTGLCYALAICKAPTACSLTGGIEGPVSTQKRESETGIFLRCD